MHYPDLPSAIAALDAAKAAYDGSTAKALELAGAYEDAAEATANYSPSFNWRGQFQSYLDRSQRYRSYAYYWTKWLDENERAGFHFDR